MKKLVLLLALLLAVPAFAEDKEGGPVFLAVPIPSAAGQFIGTDGTVPEWETLQGNAGCTFAREYAGSYVLNCSGFAPSNNPTFSGVITFTQSSWVLGPDGFSLNGSGLSINDLYVVNQIQAPDGGSWGGHGIGVSNISAHYAWIGQTTGGTADFDNLYANQFLQTVDFEADGGSTLNTVSAQYIYSRAGDFSNLFTNNLKVNGYTPGGTCTGGQFINAIDQNLQTTCATPPGGTAGITSLTAGTGITLTPSPITSTGTIAVTSGLYLPVNNPTFTGTLTGPTLSITGSATIGSLTTTTMFQAPDGSYWNSSYLNMTKPLWFNGAVMGGTCTGGQYVNALSGTGVLTCGTPAGGSSVSITAGNTGITVSPSPLTGTGTISLSTPVTIANGGTGAATLAAAHIGVTNTTNTWTLAQTFSVAPVMSGASITAATIPMAALANSGVTAGSYTNANITVNAQGLVTVAANGSAGGGLPTATAPYLTLQSNASNNAVWNANVGIGQAPGLDPIDITNNQNGSTSISLTNTNTGANAQTSLAMNSAGGAGYFGYTGSGYTATGAQVLANTAYFYTGGSGGISFVSTSTSPIGPINFWTNNTTKVASFFNGVTVGAPTGGDKGLGTINATGLYINGVAVGGGLPTATAQYQVLQSGASPYNPVWQTSPTFATTATVTMPDGSTFSNAGVSSLYVVGTSILNGTVTGGFNATFAGSLTADPIYTYDIGPQAGSVVATFGIAPLKMTFATASTVTMPDTSTWQSGLGGLIIKNDPNYPILSLGGTTTAPKGNVQMQGANAIWISAGQHQNASGTFIADNTASTALGLTGLSMILDMPQGSTVGSAVTHNYVITFGLGAFKYQFNQIATGTAGSGGGSSGGAACFGSNQQLMSNAANCIASDLKLKRDIHPIDDAMTVIPKLAEAAIYYKYKQGNEGEQPGFGAEVVAQIDPRYATFQDGKPVGVRYEQMAATEAVAIAELKKEIDDLKAQIAAMKGSPQLTSPAPSAP